MTVTLNTEKPVKKRSRINLRAIIFAAVLLLPLGWMVKTYVTLTVSKGIENTTRYGKDYKTVDLKSLGNFAFNDQVDSEQQVPREYRDLDGKKLLLSGQMFSNDGALRSNSFQLVYSIQKCCFNGPPQVQERVFCKIPNGKLVPIFDDLTDVYGTLHVRAQREAGKVISLYDLDVERIESHR
jgi:hypothetical protein